MVLTAVGTYYRYRSDRAVVASSRSGRRSRPRSPPLRADDVRAASSDDGASAQLDDQQQPGRSVPPCSPDCCSPPWASTPSASRPTAPASPGRSALITYICTGNLCVCVAHLSSMHIAVAVALRHSESQFTVTRDNHAVSGWQWSISRAGLVSSPPVPCNSRVSHHPATPTRNSALNSFMLTVPTPPARLGARLVHVPPAGGRLQGPQAGHEGLHRQRVWRLDLEGRQKRRDWPRAVALLSSCQRTANS